MSLYKIGNIFMCVWYFLEPTVDSAEFSKTAEYYIAFYMQNI